MWIFENRLWFLFSNLGWYQTDWPQNWVVLIRKMAIYVKKVNCWGNYFTIFPIHLQHVDGTEWLLCGNWAFSYLIHNETVKFGRLSRFQKMVLLRLKEKDCLKITIFQYKT